MIVWHHNLSLQTEMNFFLFTIQKMLFCQCGLLPLTPRPILRYNFTIWEIFLNCVWVIRCINTDRIYLITVIKIFTEIQLVLIFVRPKQTDESFLSVNCVKDIYVWNKSHEAVWDKAHQRLPKFQKVTKRD